MNWLIRIAQPKPLPLPVEISDEERSRYEGIGRIDRMMTQETSNMLSQQYPEIEYGGAGKVGVAFRTGPNEFMKVTHDWGEMNAATEAHAKSMDWVVPIIEEPKMIQDNPPLWGIRMKELQLIDDIKLRIFISYLALSYGSDEFPDEFQALYLVENDYPDMDIDVAKNVYTQIKYILDQNVKSLGLEDIHSRNLGWDDDGRLKVFDLGKGIRNDPVSQNIHEHHPNEQEGGIAHV